MNFCLYVTKSNHITFAIKYTRYRATYLLRPSESYFVFSLVVLITDIPLDAVRICVQSISNS